MPRRHSNTAQDREREARRLREQPGVILMHSCATCGAANPTRPDEPPPARCASCGTAYVPPPSWAGKTAPHRPFELSRGG